MFLEKIGQTLENKHPAWLDYLIVITKGFKQKHMEELENVITRLENAGYRFSKNKSEPFKTEIEWIGHKNGQKGIRPLEDKLFVKEELKKIGKGKETEIFPSCNPVSIKKYQKSFSSNRYFTTTKEEKQPLELDQRTRKGVRNFETKNHGNTVFGSLQFKLSKRNNYQLQY